MKKLLSIFLVIIALLCFTACSSSGESSNRNNTPDNSNLFEKSDKTEAIASTPLSTPVLKAITPLDIDAFTIEWSKVENADGYIVLVSEDNENFTKLTETTAEENTYTHSNLTNGITYTYKIQAFNSKQVSDESNAERCLCTNNLINFYKPYRSDKYVEYIGSDTFIMSGKHRNNSFTLTTENTSKDLYADYNLDGKYKTIEFTYGFVDGAYGDSDPVCVTLKVLADDQLIKTFEVDSSQLAQTVKLDIKKASKLEFFVEKKKSPWWGEFGFADVKLYK